MFDTALARAVRTHSYTEGCATLLYSGCALLESSALHPWVGVSISAAISTRLRVRFDPLYQRIGIDDSTYVGVYEKGVGSAFGIAAGRYSTKSNRWQVPALLEAQLSPRLRLGIGPALSILTGHRNSFLIPSPFKPDLSGDGSGWRTADRDVMAGISTAAEFPFRMSRMVIAPELRYTRWTSKHYGANWAPDQLTCGIAFRM